MNDREFSLSENCEIQVGAYISLDYASDKDWEADRFIEIRDGEDVDVRFYGTPNALAKLGDAIDLLLDKTRSYE